MTVKKLTRIEDGRLVPTDLSMDADLIEISRVEGNKLEVKEDGLYYKESIVVDGDDALNVVSGKLTVVVSPVGDNILQKTAEGLYVPTQGNLHNITTSDIDEGTNLYFTESRVNQTVLTGLDTSTATPVLDTDQILAAIGKLQAQINNLRSGGGTASYPSFTGNAGKVLTVNATEDGVEWGTCPNGETLTLLPVTNVSLTVIEDLTTPCNGATPAAVLTGYNILGMTKPPTVDVYVQNILVAENVDAIWLNQNWYSNQALIENSNLLGYSVYGTSSNTELFQYYGDGNITFRFVPKTDGFYNGQVYSAKDALQIHNSNYNPTVYKDPSTGEVTFCIGGAN